MQNRLNLKRRKRLSISFTVIMRRRFGINSELPPKRWGGDIVGVAQVGRPISRNLCDGYTLEVLRLCTNGEKDVCSFLYSRCARIAKEMGYRKIITYILETEQGTSLKASGWVCEDNHCGGATWENSTRSINRHKIEQTTFLEQKQKYPVGVAKQRWSKEL